MDIQLLNPTHPAEGDPPAPIPGNSLNVTRVTGIAALISAVIAATPIFSAEATDPTALRVAMPAIQGFIIAAALFTTAIVVAADIRGRALATVSADPTSSSKPSSSAEGGASAKQYAADLRAALGEVHDKESRNVELSALARTIEGCTPPTGHLVRNHMFVIEIDKLAADAAAGDIGIGGKFETVYRRILQTATDLDIRRDAAPVDEA